jgi:hypothetical protein
VAVDAFFPAPDRRRELGVVGRAKLEKFRSCSVGYLLALALRGREARYLTVSFVAQVCSDLGVRSSAAHEYE